MEKAEKKQTDKILSGAQGTISKSRRTRPEKRDIIAVVLGIGILCMFILLITPGAIASIAGIFWSPTSSQSLALNCTVTVESGKFWIKSAASGEWQEGNDGMVLAVGSPIKTDAQSKVMLTFFEGSTVTLEPDTEITIDQLKKAPEGYTTIFIKQVVGRTWSLVEKLTDIRSQYEIHTPSASAMVRGTSFIVDVDAAGATHVGVVKGEVDVEAQGETVPVSAGYELNVVTGMHPSAPTQMGTDVMLRYQSGNTEPKGIRSQSSGLIPVVPATH